ncbi:MBL fold metallo-hydrolase [Ideonella margarita]|uniref:MBL fold metallo-hydrolase n=1 Tax=Ideonella margarita TaxID=2984191 RepID=A0ABU9C8A4_9BURK
MRIKFIGAAGGSVTGSCTHFHYPRTGIRFLVDCGFVQGEGDFEAANTAPLTFDASQLEFVLLTHAHLDHCGLLPKLYRHGFSGDVICTAATAELARLNLLDSASHPSSLFTKDEVNRVRFKPIEDQPSTSQAAMFPVRKDLFVSFRRTAHIVGACSVTLGWLDDQGGRQYTVMSGDLGNNIRENLYQPLLGHRRSVFGYPGAIVVESTYGDRPRPAAFKSFDARIEALRELLQRELFDKKSTLLIPAFALQRTQEVLVDLVVVLKRHFADIESSTSPYLAPNRLYDDFSDGRWNKGAHAAITRAISDLPEEEQVLWADLDMPSGDKQYPYTLKPDSPRTFAELRALVENNRVHRPVDVYLDSRMARSMGAVIRKELLRRSAHNSDEFAHRNPELNDRLDAPSEEDFERLLESLLPDAVGQAPVIEIGPHTIRYVTDLEIPTRVECEHRGVIVITGGGMCDGGPVVGHLESLSTQKREVVLVQTGFMPRYSLGGRLIEIAAGNEPDGKKVNTTISIGSKVDVPSSLINLRTVNLSAYYSGHADQEGLLDFIFETDGRKQQDAAATPATVFINHGTDAARQALKAAIEARSARSLPEDRVVKNVELPAAGQKAYDLQTATWVDDEVPQTVEQLLSALLREQIKTNELLRQMVQSRSRPPATPYAGKKKKT